MEEGRRETPLHRYQGVLCGCPEILYELDRRQSQHMGSCCGNPLPKCAVWASPAWDLPVRMWAATARTAMGSFWPAGPRWGPCCRISEITSSRPTRHQEPWRFGDETLRICREYIRLRYRLIPYYYDLFWQMAQTGLPVVRPLVLEYEKDPRTRNLNDQFLVGPNLLAAPVLAQGMECRAVYLPRSARL